MARFQEFAAGDRLVYLDPFLGRGLTPTLNPLDVPGPFAHPEDELRIKGLVVQELLMVFEELLAGELGGVLTVNMRAFLRPCLRVLLDRPGSTLRDLRRFMVAGQNADLLALGRGLPRTGDFFAHEFDLPHYTSTKQALATKLRGLLDNDAFADFTCGETRLDLARAIAERKVIVFNLAKGLVGPEVAEGLGRFVLATVQSFAQRRAEDPGAPHVPVHLFVDECQNYVTDSLFTILGEARKFRVLGTLCQHTPGDGMGAERWRVLTNTTNTKLVGQLRGDAQRDGAALADVPPAEFGGLPKYEFYLNTGERPPIRFRTATHLLDWRHSMAEADWARVRAEQLARYYRPRAAPPAAAERQPMGEPEPTRQEEPARALRPRRQIV